VISQPLKSLLRGDDCTEQFKTAYENRYTWDLGFKGYKGKCMLTRDDKTFEGQFIIDENLKFKVDYIFDTEAIKAISSQLWELTVHRIRRPFKEVHGLNTFTVGDFNEIGMEVLVGGKNKGDSYRINNNSVTMVYRHIHGVVVNILTKDTFETGSGYLSTNYTSQYFDPQNNNPKGSITTFSDTFNNLSDNGPWVLTERIITGNRGSESVAFKELFSFYDLTYLK
tara:strand:+ start:312 stop:986 length:675 start_codon:yes stop_codon:yes gene_type:complete